MNIVNYARVSNVLCIVVVQEMDSVLAARAEVGWLLNVPLNTL